MNINISVEWFLSLVVAGFVLGWIAAEAHVYYKHRKDRRWRKW